jgi:hypothetical protein
MDWKGKPYQFGSPVSPKGAVSQKTAKHNRHVCSAFVSRLPALQGAVYPSQN